MRQGEHERFLRQRAQHRRKRPRLHPRIDHQSTILPLNEVKGLRMCIINVPYPLRDRFDPVAKCCCSAFQRKRLPLIHIHKSVFIIPLKMESYNHSSFFTSMQTARPVYAHNPSETTHTVKEAFSGSVSF